MSTLENKTLVRRFYDGINAHNINVFDEVCPEGFIDHDAEPNQGKGREGVKAMFRQFFEAFPDMKMEVLAMVAEGDRVAVDAKVTGTHLGAFAGVPATGRTVTVGGFDCVRVKDGKVVERWGVFDMAKLLTQLGVVPGPKAEDLKATSRRYYEAIDKTRGDLASLKTEVFHPQMTVQFGDTLLTDVASFQGLVSSFYAAFPDLTHVVHDQIAEGDTVINRLTAKGTHKGDFAGMKPTGRSVAITAMSSHRYVDGKLFEQRVQADFVGLLTQLGAIATPG
jgi:steroid delta-isomerase-like uncharacterized protein